MTHLTQDKSGNTYTDLSKAIRSRKWVLTINNYDDNIYETLKVHALTTNKYIIGKEIGKNGTPHLQCYLQYKNAIRFSNLKKLFPTAHIEKAKGTDKQNYDYCSKEGNFISNIDCRSIIDIEKQEILNDEYKDVKWKKWQQHIIDIINNKPDRRKIHWVYDEDGNVGKSYLCKYLATTKNIIIADGKKDNIYHSIFKMINEDKKIPTIILVDIPRYNKDFINYGCLEQIKNGCIYSGKYEGGICLFKIPHVIIFSNQEPDYNMMSMDRWDVIRVNKLSMTKDALAGSEASSDHRNLFF